VLDAVNLSLALSTWSSRLIIGKGANGSKNRPHDEYPVRCRVPGYYEPATGSVFVHLRNTGNFTCPQSSPLGPRDSSWPACRETAPAPLSPHSPTRSRTCSKDILNVLEHPGARLGFQFTSSQDFLLKSTPLETGHFRIESRQSATQFTTRAVK